MSNHQFHFEKKFYQDKKTGYWISTQVPKIRAHVWVWKCIHKIIPKGYHIHHINEDRSDNRIENLELILGSRHLSHHMNDPLRKQKSREMAEKYRPLTKLWHASEEGRAWHRLHAIKNNFGNPEPTKYNCQQCEKEYWSKLIAKNRTRFCSNKCKSKWRRENKLDYITKICPVCLNEYNTSKYARAKTCSRICGKKKNLKPIG
jgi:hypothetical protein